jgi:hypothetical protein
MVTSEEDVFSGAPVVQNVSMSKPVSTPPAEAVKKERAERRPSNHPLVIMERFESLTLSEQGDLLRSLNIGFKNRVDDARKQLEEQQAKLASLS